MVSGSLQALQSLWNKDRNGHDRAADLCSRAARAARSFSRQLQRLNELTMEQNVFKDGLFRYQTRLKISPAIVGFQEAEVAKLAIHVRRVVSKNLDPALQARHHIPGEAMDGFRVWIDQMKVTA